MPSLQIRELPDEVYQALAYRAERAGRSLAQQAIAELRKIPELEAGVHRREVARKLRADVRQHGTRTLPVPPEVLIREDRER